MNDYLPAYWPRTVTVFGDEMVALYPVYRYWVDITGKIPATRAGDSVTRFDLGNEPTYFAKPRRLLTDQSKVWPFKAVLS